MTEEEIYKDCLKIEQIPMPKLKYNSCSKDNNNFTLNNGVCKIKISVTENMAPKNCNSYSDAIFKWHH